MLEFSEIDPFIHKCVRCGTCKAVVGLFEPSCPAGERFRFEGFYSSGKIWIARGIKEGVLCWDDPELLKKLFACTLCGNCTQQCPMTVRERILEVFEAMRCEAVRSRAAPLEAHKRLSDSIAAYRNPWGQPRKRRTNWAKGEKVRRIGPAGDAERASVLYYVGCTAALDPSLHHVAKSTARVLEKAGVDFGILGEREPCCGSVLLRVGLRDQARELAQETIRAIHETGADTVVTSCAGCYKTLTQDYRFFGHLEPRIVHSSEYFLELIRQGRLRVGRMETPLVVTYHDPCHLGRHTGLFDQPRALIEALDGLQLREMPRNRANAWCCGAGGGVRSAFAQMALETACERIEEACGTGARLLVTSCPFCLQNLESAIRFKAALLEPADVTDLVARCAGVGVEP